MHNLIKKFSSVAGNLSSVLNINRKVKDLVFQGLYNQALQLYKNQIHFTGNNNTTFISILPSIIKACSLSQSANFLGIQLHCYTLKLGFNFEPIISNSLISMYAKLSDTQCARQLFDTMTHRDSISWSAMINCFTQNGFWVQSLNMFKDMYVCGFVPKPELIAGIISVCIRFGHISLGREIHALSIVDERIGNSVFLSTALIDLYWKCQDSYLAFWVFNEMEEKNEVSWTTMIAGYVSIHDYGTALDCFREMIIGGIIKPNRVTLISVLPASASLNHGKEIHGYAFHHGFDSDIHFSSTLINLYSRYGESSRPSKLLFEKSPKKDVVLWSSIIAGCSQDKEAIVFFNQMRRDGVQPNSVTLLAVISACTNIPSIILGRAAHSNVLKSGLNFDLSIGNSLINMYSKCGCLGESQQIFREMPVNDCVSWSALINAYGLHGCGEKALQLFSEMQEREIEYDSVTFLAVLSACNHAGLIEEGGNLFDRAMREDKLSLTLEHYACHIDLLGRAGKIELACDVMRKMPMKPSERIWSSLVSACKVHGRLEVAKILLSWLVKSEPDNAANHTLLSLIYAESRKWSSVEGVWRDMNVRGLKKNYGFSRLEN